MARSCNIYRYVINTLTGRKDKKKMDWKICFKRDVNPWRKIIWRSYLTVFDIKLLFSISLSSIFRKFLMSCDNWLRMERFPFQYLQIRKCNILEFSFFNFFFGCPILEEGEEVADKFMCRLQNKGVIFAVRTIRQTNKQKRNEAWL